MKDPELQDKVPSEFLSHKQKYEEAVRKACVVFKKLEKMGGGFESYKYASFFFLCHVELAYCSAQCNAQSKLGKC